MTGEITSQKEDTRTVRRCAGKGPELSIVGATRVKTVEPGIESQRE